MIEKSFIHIQGIGKTTEERLWQRGITSWDLFEKAHASGEKLPQAKIALAAIATSRKHLAQGDLRYFETLFPASEAWRLYPGHEARTCFLDIETTGDGRFCHITTIALYDGTSVSTYVRGENLKDFQEAIRQFDTVVTYNGKSFDLPVIRREMQLPMEMAHIDLRYVLGALGIKGGLKKCEETLGLDRKDLTGLDGYAAVLMWRAFRHTKERRYLETLLAYNVADTINMEPLLHEACRRHSLRLPLGMEPLLKKANRPQNPYIPDARVISEMKTIQGCA